MSPSTNWKETIPEGEDAALQRLAEALRELQRAKAQATGEVRRALHAKGNLGVEAELTVLPDLPEHLRHGLFAKPATYRAYVRYSNGSGAHQHDKAGDVRGVAVKVLGVPGKKVIPGMEDATTQDFLAIRTPSTPFRDADEFVGLVVAARSPALALPRVLFRFGISRGFSILKQLTQGLNTKLTTLASTRYFSALPVQLGPYAMRYALSPHDAAEPAGDIKTPNHLGDALAARLKERPVVYDLQVQLFVSEEKTPIEDASVEWREEDSPFVTVARLTLGKQDTSSPHGKRVIEAIESMSFDPWHALVEHKPLGNMMRARAKAYLLSAQERGLGPEPTADHAIE